MEAVKKFALAAAKIGVGITVAMLLVAGAALLYSKISTDAEERANAPLAERKDWGVIKAEALGGASFELATMWNGGRLFYQLEIDGYPTAIASVRESGAAASFILKFFNSQGFTIFERDVPLREMSETVPGADGVRTGLSWSDNESRSADTYRDAVGWNIGWTGFLF